jgi:hypothetical protein
MHEMKMHLELLLHMHEELYQINDMNLLHVHLLKILMNDDLRLDQKMVIVTMKIHD